MPRILVVATTNAIFLVFAIAFSHAATVSDADGKFVAMVSQGGMYEVELGKLAQSQGHAQDIKDQGQPKRMITSWSARSSIRSQQELACRFPTS